MNNARVMPKWSVLIIILLGIIFTLFLIRFASGEDNWICRNGQWIEHGHPSATKPTSICK